MISNKLVSENFSRAAVTYDKEAEFQKYSSEKLAEIIRENCECNSLNPKTILEIGCGTGFLTEKVLRLFPNAKFTLTDISPQMLEICAEKSSEFRKQNEINSEFIVNDIASGSPKDRFDLIISSLTLQWLENLPSILESLEKSLTPGGLLIFNTLGDLTFSALRNTFGNLGLKYPGPTFIDSMAIAGACQIFEEFSLESEIYDETHPSLLVFLRHLRRTGAGNATRQRSSPRELKLVLGSAPTGEYIAKYHLLSISCLKS